MGEVVGMGLGPKIRGLREQIGMSQAQLAAQAELSQGYLSQIENDEVQNPSAAVLFRLAQALHVDPRCLLEAAGYHDPLGAARRRAGGSAVRTGGEAQPCRGSSTRRGGQWWPRTSVWRTESGPASGASWAARGSRTTRACPRGQG